MVSRRRSIGDDNPLITIPPQRTTYSSNDANFPLSVKTIMAIISLIGSSDFYESFDNNKFIVKVNQVGGVTFFLLQLFIGFDIEHVLSHFQSTKEDTRFLYRNVILYILESYDIYSIGKFLKTIKLCCC